MARRPSLLFDLACVAISASEIASRAASIQSRRVLGERAVKRDWYGNEIGVKAADYTAESRSSWTNEEKVVKREEIPFVPFGSPSVPTAIPSNLRDPFPRPASDKLLVDEMQKLPKDSAPLHSPDKEPLPPFSAPFKPTPIFTKDASAHEEIPAKPLTSSEIPLLANNSLLKTARDSHPRNAPLPMSPRPPLADIEDDRPAPVMRASKVPSSALGRFFHYGSLTAGLATGAATEYLRRQTSGSSEQHSVMMSEANVNRLVNKLSQMRGAALKLGQFMSIQDAHVLPDQIEAILRRVQNAAHYMPTWQMEQVMSRELGENWKALFDEFDPIPIASASIGQVHRATLSPSSPFYPAGSSGSSSASPPFPVAVKVQFPGVENSI
ncbi:hypothetical protein FRB90_005473, partial [Tulasnella sp. 427]